MANNMIALQARAPAVPNIGNLIATRNSMLAQQRAADAAQRQAEQTQQTLALAQSREDREAKAAQIDFVSKVAAQFRNDLVLAGNDLSRIAAARARVVDAIQAYDKILPPAEILATDDNQRNRALMTADQLANKSWATPTSSAVYDPTTKKTYNVVTGGLPPGMGGTAGAYELQTYALDPNYRGPAANTPPPMTAPTAAAPAPTAGAELPATGDPIEAAAQAIVAGKTPRDPAFVNLSNEQFDQAQQRAREIGAQPNPPLQPMSYSPSGQQPDLANIVQTMLDTGVVSQANVDAMRQAAGPGKDAQLAQILREHNIRIMPDEGMPGARMGGGEYDPARDAATMQPAQYIATGKAFGGRDTSQGPVPGVYNVPPRQIHEKAQAERQTPTEIYNEERAKEQARADVARNAPPKPLTAVQETALRNNMGKNLTTAQTTLDTMQRVIDTVEEIRRLPPEVKEAITGYSAYLPSLYGSTKEGDRLIDNLKGLVTAMGRSQAQLSGSLGNMAVQEWKIVSDQIAGLDLHKLDSSGLDKQLDTVAQQARAATTRVQDAYEQTHAEDFARYPGRFQLRSPASQRAQPRTTGGGGRIQSGPYKGMTADEVERRILGGGR